ncbi:DUF6517 family protein [Halodesulfurarchaeum sp.]|uniref:DUF6517 family protein n=1 Tax=Halodesulfurarchaeum sp. TaxID=1980530 RepID=UPI002FC38F7F
MNRRIVAVLALTALIMLSGCALLTGETLEFTAGQASVSDEAQQTAQYELLEMDTQSINRTVEALGQDRTVKATNHIARYERGLAVTTTETVGTVVVISTPQMNVAGQSVNPVGSMPPQQLLETVAAGQDGFSDVSQRENRTMTVLGEDATVTVFDATTEYGGQSVDVTVHLVRVTHEGDYVIGLAVHPTLISGEQAGVDTMFGGIEHTGTD